MASSAISGPDRLETSSRNTRDPGAGQVTRRLAPPFLPRPSLPSTLERPRMTLRQRLLALVGATALMGLTLVSGASQPDDQAHISVTITGGPLLGYLSSASGGYPAATDPEDSDGSASGTLGLRVLDERGLATGWTVWLATKNYSGPGGHIGTDQLTFSAGSIAVIGGNANLTGQTTATTGGFGTPDEMRWISAPHFGDGEYDLPLNGTLRLPGSARSDAYTYTVIVNVIGLAP